MASLCLAQPQFLDRNELGNLIERPGHFFDRGRADINILRRESRFTGYSFALFLELVEAFRLLLSILAFFFVLGDEIGGWQRNGQN